MFHDGGSLLFVQCAHESVPSAWDKSQGKFQFFAPHRLLVEKVQTSSITQNSGQVSLPPPNRITILMHFAWCQQANKQKHCTVNAPEH